MPTRRQVIRYGLAAGVLVTTRRGPTGSALAGEAALSCQLPAAAGGTVVLSSIRPEPFTQSLVTPAVIAPVRTDESTDYYELVQREAAVEIIAGTTTQVWGYDGVFPGPTIVAATGRAVAVRQVNQLPSPVSVHLHGGVTSPGNDGHPDDLIPPGGVRDYYYPNRQRAATLWYHDHAAHLTAPQIYRGLAGLYIIEDLADADLGLPTGDRDVPLLIQDRTFDDNAQLVYTHNNHSGFFGDVMLVNGVPHPRFEVAATAYRLRLVNASNARIYRLALDDDAAFTLIGTDGGLRSEPLELTSVTLSPAERAEVIVDFSRYAAGTEIILEDRRNPVSPGVLRFDVTSDGAGPTPLPSTLRPVEALPAPLRIRDVLLTRNDTTGEWLLNGAGFDGARFDYVPRLGSVEHWRLRNDSPMAHPMHLHLVMFQILDRDGLPPGEAERGWKDTVLVNPGETVTVAARFEGSTGRFVYHCHNLEHEDHDMMAQFRVVDLARLAGAGRVETAAAVSAGTFAPLTPAAFVATADGFADALAGGPAAALSGGPVLLTASDQLPQATAEELDRLRPARIVVLGGPAAVSEAVEAELARFTDGGVSRLAGPDRFATAAAVSEATFAAGVAAAYVATGESFPDALAGGAAAAVAGGPVLLTASDQLPQATAEELDRLRPARIVVLGGPAAVSEAVEAELARFTDGGVSRLAGPDRFATAAAVARAVFTETPTVFVATGTSFPDALAAVPAAAAAGAPLLLVTHDTVPPATAAELRRLLPHRIVLLGGPGAVAVSVEAMLLDAMATVV